MASNPTVAKELQHAAKVINGAKAMVITAGAGMGVDSGLPDFRGPEGFWRAYPPLKKLGIQLTGMSNPRWFLENPEFAWGFFGHRYNLYKKTEPHRGFHILRKWAEKMASGYFIFTSNVDGHFQKAGFAEDKVCECHGSINFLQYVDNGNDIWPVPEDFKIDVDERTLHAKPPLPFGPGSGTTLLARPNVLMFSDWTWIGDRTEKQERRFNQFQGTLGKDGGIPFAVIEIGAGLAVPTVRFTSESLVSFQKKGTLIRINPKEPQVPSGHISLPLPGLEALDKIDSIIAQIDG